MDDEDDIVEVRLVDEFDDLEAELDHDPDEIRMDSSEIREEASEIQQDDGCHPNSKWPCQGNLGAVENNHSWTRQRNGAQLFRTSGGGRRGTC